MSYSYAARYTARRAVSTPMAMSASMNATAWWLKISVPMVLRVRAY